MKKRFVAISFPYLLTDWWALRLPHIKNLATVIVAPSHGRMVIVGLNILAAKESIYIGMVLADARAIIPDLHVINEQPKLAERLLKKISEWCIRFTPVSGTNPPDTILLDVSGCGHLWGGEEQYITYIYNRFVERGYYVRAAMADTIGVAWALAHYATEKIVIAADHHSPSFLSLPPHAMRPDPEIADRLLKLGLRKISNFIDLPSDMLFRRFGSQLMERIEQARGNKDEIIIPVHPVEIYSERLPCLEPISTAKGIEIALERLVETLCKKLKCEEKGLRKAIFKCYRADNLIVQIETGTNRPSSNAKHLIKLLSEKITSLEPGPGIELFVLDAPVVETHHSQQNSLWGSSGSLQDGRLSELLDTLSAKLGVASIARYIPDEHYWPERSFQKATSIHQPANTEWRTDKPRPVQLLKNPEPIQVTAPIPDYPPMLFRYKGKLHRIVKADGPERIEQEWWIQEGEHRDYYYVEDEDGSRYWLFRSGHYEAAKQAEWFLHGLFA